MLCNMYVLCVCMYDLVVIRGPVELLEQMIVAVGGNRMFSPEFI